jgi:hypothetical protein
MAKEVSLNQANAKSAINEIKAWLSPAVGSNSTIVLGCAALICSINLFYMRQQLLNR